MLGFFIQQHRKEKGWSQLQLSKELNVSPSTVGMYEQGRRTPVTVLIPKKLPISSLSSFAFTAYGACFST